jgi:hypothetical protein
MHTWLRADRLIVRRAAEGSYGSRPVFYGWSALIAVLLILSTSAFSQPAPIDCHPPVAPANQENCLVQKLKIDWIIRAYDTLFGQDVHAVIGNIVPGSGITGGIGYTHQFPADSTKPPWTKTKILDLGAKVSTTRYWEVSSNLFFNFADDRKKAKPDRRLNVYAIVRDLPRLDYYGLGPESRKQDRAVYNYLEAVFGVDGKLPINKQVDLGAAIEGILPHITPIADLSVRSVERAFSQASAPGINSQPPTLHVALFAGLHGKGEPESWNTQARFSYHFYQDLRDSTYSFRRFDADLLHGFLLGKKASNTNPDPREKTELRFRGLLSLTDVSSGHTVPFYLMRTLGGSDLRGIETLRGFADYRFRDKDMVLVQAEFVKPIYGPINVFVFNDTGKVAPSIKDFKVGRLRDTFGIGLAIVPSQLHAYLFRFYVAFGSGEGFRAVPVAGDVSAVGTRLFR